jgi:hypothetical protein
LHGIYHQGLIKVLIKEELEKRQRTWDQFLIQSGFKIEVHPPAQKLTDKFVEPMQGASSSTSPPVVSRKNKRKTSLKISDEQVEATPTSLQTGEGSSHALGGGRHPFPHAQKVYIKKSKRLAEPMMLNEIQEPETVEVHANPVQPKEPIPKIVPPSSSSFEDDVDRYKILIRKRSTRPQNKFRLKSKAMYNPAIKDKVIVIDEEPTNPNVEAINKKEGF